MDRPRITETDKNIIIEWLSEMSLDPVQAISIHTGDETRLIANMTKQLITKQQEEIDNWIEAYDMEH